MERRNFLTRTGLLFGGGLLAESGPASAFGRSASAPQAAEQTLQTWSGVREQFAFTRDRINMACMLIASHPRPVREAIERHRQGFDEDPITYLLSHFSEGESGALRAAAAYMGVEPTDIALTNSTTMGLGLLYAGLSLRPDQEILTTYHDHVATDTALQFKATASGAGFRRVRLYDQSEQASVASMAAALEKALGPKTRIVALTHVHSTSGVKLPIAPMAEVVARANAGRDEADRALLCVDGVHGFGVEDTAISTLGCDFFVAGTHKWIFGPNGTGLVWGRPGAWRHTNPVMDSIALRQAWASDDRFAAIRQAAVLSPGGLTAFEHRWAVAEAFRFHLGIGKARVAGRIRALTAQLKEGLRAMPQVKLRTPWSEDLSSGIVCFDVDGMRAEAGVAALADRRILATVSAPRIEDHRPFDVHHVRLTAGLLNDEAEVDRTLRAVRELRRTSG
jgi:isopenicillin-N epimerase